MGSILIEPLTASAFSSFGQVIELAVANHYPINAGARQIHGLDVMRQQAV